ncbi:MAG TPA: mechanosensitive ion channel, partial [Ignavibacteriaceae bacterium]|nr:mechanosensitive ion channel [Ignavibacteriaceae bacterium]
RMIDLIVGIGYQDDIDKAKSTLQSIIDGDADILKQPTATIAVGELADSSVRLYVGPWVPNKKAVEVRFRLIEQIKKRFDEENISIPYPQRDVYLHQSK